MNITFPTVKNLSDVQKNRSSKNFSQPFFSSGLSNDVFVKSLNTVNFKGDIEDKNFDNIYSQLKAETTDYILNSETITEDGLESIIKKYSPDVTVDNMKNLPRNLGRYYTGGYTTDSFGLILKDNNILAFKIPQTVYLPFKNFENEKERIIFLNKTLHEFSHVLQNSAADKMDLSKIIAQYLKSGADISDIQMNLKLAQQIYSVVETELLEKVFRGFSHDVTHLPSKITKDTEKTPKSLFRNKYGVNIGIYFEKYINSALLQVQNNFEKVNTEFILNFMQQKAKNEMEAYQNALQSDKECLGMEEYTVTDYDILVKSYNILIKAIQIVKNSN